MSEKRYKIVFNSENIPENDADKIRESLSAILKLDDEKCEHLFSGRPVVIRSNVDRRLARRYQSAFKSAGTWCRIIDVGQKSTESAIENACVQEIDAQAEMICPNCHFKQDPSPECIRCGVIISKCRAEKPEEAPRRKEYEGSEAPEEEDDNLAVTGEFSDKTAMGYKWILERIIPKKLEYFSRNYVKKYLSRRNPFYNYGARVIDISIQAALLILVTLILNTILLYLYKMLWHLYISTPVGKKFLETFPAKARSIFDLISWNTTYLSMELTREAFSICLAISAICQVFHIARYFYLPRGFIGKIAVWGLPLAAIVAVRIQLEFGFDDFGLAYIIAVVPTLCVFSGCFKFSYELLPEVGTLFEKALQLKTQFIETTLPGLLRRIK